MLLHDVEYDVALTVSCSAQRRGGPGCLVSTVLLRCSSSPPCPSFQSLPGSCCWTKGTTRPARKVRQGFSVHGYGLQRNCSLNQLFCYTVLALRRLWGNKDHSMEVEEMLQEKAALQNVRSHSVMELIRDQSVRWQLITIIFTFTPLQLCGSNAVSYMKYTLH